MGTIGWTLLAAGLGYLIAGPGGAAVAGLLVFPAVIGK
jgi:hypothetical protein